LGVTTQFRPVAVVVTAFHFSLSEHIFYRQYLFFFLFVRVAFYISSAHNIYIAFSQEWNNRALQDPPKSQQQCPNV
jgi:hypothetical protein